MLFATAMLSTLLFFMLAVLDIRNHPVDAVAYMIIGVMFQALAFIAGCPS
jgi:hypothetical protein